MKCFILAAGFGKRMGDLTINTPKPLLKLGNFSLLQISIARAYNWGFKEFIINSHYHANQIEAELKKSKEIQYKISLEKDKILGTAGGIKTAIDGYLQENEKFLIMNPDSLFFPTDTTLLAHKKYSGKALLYLAAKSSTDTFTGLNLKNGKVYFENGNNYYIGLSFLNSSIFKETIFGEYSEITEIFRNLSKNNELDGELFSGKIYDSGEKMKYFDLVKNNPIENDKILLNTLQKLFM
jgi:MurNAc alpha-1-phosphate uridylyltransferase